MFNTKTALLMAKLSEIAYEVNPDKLKELGFDLVTAFGGTKDVSGYIAESPECVVLAFKGTVLTEWDTVRDDLMFWHHNEAGVAYDEGFYDAYEELELFFWPYIENIKKPLFLTGHSLGGAIAVISAMHLFSFEACYTFGSPRVCNSKGLPLAKKEVYRVVHENDIVPSLPLLVMGYRQVGQMFYLTAANTIMTGTLAYIVRTFTQIWPLMKKNVFGLLDFIDNHFIKKYVESLEVVNKRG
jgi:triacylglycerol lipase